MNTLFPLYIKLEEMNTLVVGGGNVGLEKIEALLKNAPNAPITMVAPFFRDVTIDFLKDYPQVVLKEKPYDTDDLTGMDIVIGATDDPELHKKIRKEAKERKLIVNIADTPQLCDFYMSSIVRKGDLKVAISSNGKSPTFTKRFKEVLNEVLDDDFDQLLDNLKNVRDRLKGDFSYKVKELNKITENLVKNDKKEEKDQE